MCAAENSEVDQVVVRLLGGRRRGLRASRGVRVRGRRLLLCLVEDADLLTFICFVGNGRVEVDAGVVVSGAGDVERLRALSLRALDCERDKSVGQFEEA